MKINDFNVATQAIITDVTAREQAARTNYENAAEDTSADEKNTLRLAHKELVTKLRYVNLLTRESTINMSAKLIKNAEMLQDITSDSYALSKFSDIVQAITSKSKEALNDDHALSQAVAFLVAKDFKHVTHNDIRKQLTSKTDASVCHKTDRQASMICKLFERLNAATREKLNDVKATKFDTSSLVIVELNKLFA